MLAQDSANAQAKAFNTESAGGAEKKTNRGNLFLTLMTEGDWATEVPWILKVPFLHGHIFNSSRRRLVWARLTGTSEERLSAIFNM